jgi:hypothetical protein
MGMSSSAATCRGVPSASLCDTSCVTFGGDANDGGRAWRGGLFGDSARRSTPG